MSFDYLAVGAPPRGAGGETYLDGCYRCLFRSPPLASENIKKILFSTSSRSCSCETGCSLVSNENIFANEEATEWGGALERAEGGSRYRSPNAHPGVPRRGSVARDVAWPAEAGFHTHVPVNNRRFNPPTPTDVLFFLRAVRNTENSGSPRRVEFVLCEEGVYALTVKPGTLPKVKSGDYAAALDYAIKNADYVCEKPGLGACRFGETLADLGAPMQGTKVPFFQSRANLEKYSEAFGVLGVSCELRGYPPGYFD